MSAPGRAVLALSGGVGGAKLALGLAQECAAGQLHVVANTGDDFRHLGLYISPDIDTLLYTLSGRANQSLGWGLAAETWHTMEALQELGGDTWFRLGDRDLATHLWRSQQLAMGRELGEVTADLARRLGVQTRVFPMSDDPIATTVHTPEGLLPFQHYFVRYQCQPVVTGFSFAGIESARPNAELMAVLGGGAYAAIVVCPSNPFVSVDPILQVPGLWQALRDQPAPVILVSPIVAGRALKGPAAKMMTELGHGASALEVARFYHQRYPGLVDYFVIDSSDATLAPAIGELDMDVAITCTVMHSAADKRALARFCLALGGA